MIIESQAYARAGVIGNPSDGYYGKTIACIVKNFSARVLLYESPELKIELHSKDHSVFGSIKELVNDVQFSGYYGGIRLIKATIKRFYEYTQANNIDLPERNFTIRYDTTIPLRVGLAGSSGIATATLRALMQFYEVTIPKMQQPSLILSVETEELGIAAGLQDRVAQVYEGAVFMDFNRDYMEEHGYGKYEALDYTQLPPLFVAYREELSEGTEVFHNNIRERWQRGEAEVRTAMQTFAELTEEFRDAMASEDTKAMAHIINRNFDTRAGIFQISAENWQLVNTARNLGAPAKFCGSGGAIIGMYDDEAQVKKLRKAYREIGAELILPEIA